MKILSACAVLGSLFVLPSAHGDTLTTGVLSPDTVRLLCKREGAHFYDLGSDGYGCRSISLVISCRPTLDCVTRARDLDPYVGGGTNLFLRQHGETRFESVHDEE